MRIRVLGPLVVRADGGDALPPGTRKQQAVLALLAVNAGRVTALDDLVDELWPERPPASAVANVRGYAAALRRLFESVEPGGERLVRRGSGYLLRATPEELDLLAYAANVAEARDALRDGDAAAAAAGFDAALALWEGPMLAGLPRGPVLAARCAAVEDDRLTAVEQLAEARLSLAAPGDAAALLREHLSAHPLRERAVLLLMRALYRLGDVAGAMAVYDRARTALVDQLGIEPGTELRDLHRAMLRRDPALGAPPPAATSAGPATAVLPTPAVPAITATTVAVRCGSPRSRSRSSWASSASRPVKPDTSSGSCPGTALAALVAPVPAAVAGPALVAAGGGAPSAGSRRSIARCKSRSSVPG
ncbi:MAG TPA: AfsR/SARP family transcriptional regulator, partial [Pilimelia sp.]|nr:AfsR/SARP family transcriptional regulator [Pilimelia sp.]